MVILYLNEIPKIKHIFVDYKYNDDVTIVNFASINKINDLSHFHENVIIHWIW